MTRSLHYLFAVLSGGVVIVASLAAAPLQGKRIAEEARIPLPSEPMERRVLEADLIHIFDDIAERHEFVCKVCEPISSGRSYSRQPSARSPLALTVNFDREAGRLYYAIQAYAADREPDEADEIEGIRADIAQALTDEFASVKIVPHERAATTGRIIHVSKADRSTSYRDRDNQVAYQRALAIVEKVATDFGLKQAHAGMYYTGKLLGPAAYERELTMGAAIGESPLISIQVDRRSGEYAQIHGQIVNELQVQLKREFGERRVSIR